MKNPWVIIGIIAVVLFGGAMFLSGLSTEKNNEGVVVEDYVAGNPDAEIVLVEYSDFQCPACKAYQPAVEELIATYGESLRFEYRHFPLNIHPLAAPAAVAAEAAGQQGKFYEYASVLFQNQETWSSVAIPTGLFVSYAEQLGLDTEQFQRQMKSTLLRDKVRDSFNEAREQGLTGTPTFFLNGERLDVRSLEELVVAVATAIEPGNASSTESAPAASGALDVQFGI